jgi:hypothetical protein
MFKRMKMSFARRHAAVCPRLSLRSFRLLLSDFFKYFFPLLFEYQTLQSPENNENDKYRGAETFSRDFESLSFPAELGRHPYTCPFPNDHFVYTVRPKRLFSLEINILYLFSFTFPMRAVRPTKLPAMPKNL